MRRLLLFFVLAAAGSAFLIHRAGGLEGPAHQRPRPIVSETLRERDNTPRIDTGRGSPDIEGIVGITQPAPPRAIVWKDRLSDERIEIPTFTPWSFTADDAAPLRTMDTEKQGVRCRNVVFRLHRTPNTRAEAMALLHNQPEIYEELLHQRFTAKEARVFGRLGEVLARRTSENDRGLADTRLELDGDVVILDREQGLVVRGTEVTLWPEQQRADGRGPFVMTHEAFVVEGDGLGMEREKEKGWSRITIRKNPSLRIVSEGLDRDGKPLFDFGSGDFRPLQIAAEGRAVIVRQDGRRETVIKIELHDGVHAVQEGGRTLRCDHAELIAVRAGSPEIRRGHGWRLQHFRADQGVSIDYSGHTSRGESYMTSAHAERLIHDVPAEGASSTVLEGDVVIHLHGEIAVLGPGGRLRLACRERAWIGPLPAGAPSGDLDRGTLQQIGLRGEARIERETLGDVRQEDVLEAEAIDLVVQSDGAQSTRSPLEAGARMVAVHFAAMGAVRVSGTRIRGSTQRLVADDLHTENPHITAEGPGTRFEFPDLGREQRLLGPDAEQGGSTVQGEEPSRGRWVLERLVARGRVDVSTSMGGPALGIPAHMAGDEIAYDRLSRRASLRATGAGPARIAWNAAPTVTNHLAMRELTMDRARGRLTAAGGVAGEIHVARGGGATALRLPTPTRTRTHGTTLAVQTDALIDLQLAREGDSLRPSAGAQQVLRIRGPVTTELLTVERVVDRMRSESLEVSLVFLAPQEPMAVPSRSTARAGTSAARPASQERSRPRGPLESMTFKAGTVTVDLVDGDVDSLEARAAVELESREGRVHGERVTYEDTAQRIQVFGSSKRSAVAYLGRGEQRSEIRAQRLLLELTDGRIAHLEAHASAGSTGEVQLYRDVAAKPGQLEWFAVTYTGAVVIDPEALRAERVRVIRRLRDAGSSTWGTPAVLWAPSMLVRGRGLLATDESARHIDRIQALGPGQQDVHFRSGAGEDLVEVWGHRFDFDVPGRTARLTGQPDRDVTMQTGGGLHSWYTSVTIDMNTNLPAYISGSRILWRPREDR